MYQVTLKDFRDAIDKYIEQYGDTAIVNIVKHSEPTLKEYILVLQNKKLNDSLHILCKQIWSSQIGELK